MTGPSATGGDLDPRYIEARRVLLNALFALVPHGSAIIVAGAQAIYLRTGASDMSVAPYAGDGDLTINPSLLGDQWPTRLDSRRPHRAARCGSQEPGRSSPISCSVHGPGPVPS